MGGEVVCRTGMTTSIWRSAHVRLICCASLVPAWHGTAQGAAEEAVKGEERRGWRRQLGAHAQAGAVDGDAVEHRVRAREVDVLEDAPAI